MPFSRPRWLAAFVAFCAAISALYACAHNKAQTPSRSDDAQALTMTGALSNGLVKTGASAQLVARVSLEARPLDKKDRPPVNLALLVDTSGSMEGKPIEDARAASLALVESLQPKDRLAVVVFHSKTEVLLPSTTIEDAGKDEVKKKIRAMTARGTTDMAGGLAAAIEEVARHMQGDGINRVLLLGDGVPNESAQLMPLVQGAADRGISVTALGLGPDYDELLMGKIAQTTGGRFHYVSDSSKVAAFFQEEIVRLQRVYAKNAILELTAGPGVSIDAVVGQEISRVGNVVRVNVGDISLGDKRDFIVRLSTGARPHDGAPIELMDAALKFTAASGGSALERNVFLGAHAASDDAKIAAARDPKVLDAAAKAQAAADTLEQIRRARDSDRPRSQNEPRSPGGARPAPAPIAPAPAMAPEKRMEMHDEAMQVLQGMR